MSAANRRTAGRVAWLCLSAAVGLHGYAQAQDPERAQRQEVYQRYLEFGSLIKGGSVNPHWMTDGNSFWYAEGAPDETVIYKVDPVANTKKPLFDTPRLRRSLAAVLDHQPPYAGLPFDQFTFIDGGGRIRFSLEGAEYALDLDSYAIERLPTPAPSLSTQVVGERDRITPRTFRKETFLLVGILEYPEGMSPDGQWFASVKDHNIQLRSTYDGREEPLTVDGAKGYSWDVETVKWNPWSPNGLRLAAFKVDARGMFHVPQVHWLKSNEEVQWVPTTKAGGLLHRTEPYVIDILSKQAVPLEVGDTRDQYFTVLGWRPDGSELLLSRFSRDFKRVDILAADPETGATRPVLTETSSTFVKMQHDIIYAGQEGFTLLPDGERFIWESERDGWNHLYLYDLEGNEIRQLTKGNFPVLDVVAVDMANGWVYFTAHAEPRLYDTHLYRVSLDGNGFSRLTDGTGQHSVQFAPSKQHFLDTHSSVDRPPIVRLQAADGTLLQTLAEANIDELQAVGWTPPEEFVVKAADGETDLYGVMFKPYDFDPNREYPVIEYIYAGPQTTWVVRDFGALQFGGPDFARFVNLPRALPQLGYVVVMVDARGTPERSKAFHDVVYGAWGRHEIPDHAEAIRQLAAERPYMDLNRVGIFGASWGGQFTFRALAQAPELYRVGVSIVPGFDPYAFILYEPYLGMPQGNKAAYEYASPFSLAGKIEGNLLLVGNTSDHATFRDVVRMAEALVREGKHHDVMLLPNQAHGAVGKSMGFMIEGLVQYFEEHLKPEPSSRR